MNLERFREAHQYSYETALKEIKNGRKETCWMWYIFPQIAGLGCSSTSRYYAIADLHEAREYLLDPVLGSHLIEISQELLKLKTDDVYLVFGFPDNQKLKSSMTLFSEAAPEESVFKEVLDKFFMGEKDMATLKYL